jgi:hypothetical protein
MVKHRSDTWWLDDREVGWYCVRFAPCTRKRGVQISRFSLKIKVDGFSRFGLKTGGYCSYSLASKPLARVSRFGPQNRQLWFDDLAHKISMTVSWFRPQNHMRGGLSVCASKPMYGWRWCEDTRWHLAACFIGKQVGLEFPSFASKLVNERWRVVHVTSSWRSRGCEAKDSRFDAVEGKYRDEIHWHRETGGWYFHQTPWYISFCFFAVGGGAWCFPSLWHGLRGSLWFTFYILYLIFIALHFIHIYLVYPCFTYYTSLYLVDYACHCARWVEMRCETLLC